MPIGDSIGKAEGDLFTTAAPDPSFSSVQEQVTTIDNTPKLRDAFFTENYIGSSIQSSRALGDGSVGDFVRDLFLGNPLITGNRTLDPNFNPGEYLDRIGRPDVAKQAAYANTEEEVDRVIAFVDEQNRARANVSSSVSGFLSALGAGILTPDIVIGGSSILRATKTLHDLGKLSKAGQVTAATAGSAALGAGVMGIQEHVLQSTQTERTDLESEISILGGAFLFGLGGAAASALKGKSFEGFDLIKKDVGSAIAGKENRINLEDVSAAKSSYEELLNADVELKPIGGLSQKTSEAIFRNINSVIPFFRSPSVQGLTSIFNTIKTATHGLFEHNMIVKGMDEGKQGVTSVQSKVAMDRLKMETHNRRIQQHYRNWVKGQSNEVTDTGNLTTVEALKAAFARPGSKLSKEKFSAELDRAVRYGSDDPNLKAAAGEVREVLREWGAELQSRGILDKNVDINNPTFLMRQFDKAKISANPQRAAQKIEEGFRARAEERMSKMAQENDIKLSYAIDAAGRRMVKLSGQLDEAGERISELQAEVKKYNDPDYYGRAAVDARDNMRSLSDEQSVLDAITRTNRTQSKGSFLKQRVLDIDDKYIDEFIKHDAITAVNSYAHRASGMARLHDFFGEDGPAKLFEDLQEEFRLRSEAANKKDIPALQEEYDKTVDWLQKAIPASVGMLKDSNRLSEGLRTLRTYQMMAMLGGVLISSLPDAGNLIGARVLGESLEKEVNRLAKSIAANVKIPKSAKQKAAIYDVIYATEVEAGSVIKAVNNIDSEVIGRTQTRFGRATEAIVAPFGRVTGGSYWNGAWKRVGAKGALAGTIRRILEYAETGSLPKKELEWMARHGINESDFQPILRELKNSLTEVNGAIDIDFGRFTNKALAEKLQAASLKMANTVVVTPGAGDIPLSVKESAWVATMFQFKSFATAITPKFTIRALQSPDGAIAMAAITSLSLGATVVALKAQLSGRPMPEDIGEFMVAAATRSGWAGLSGDIAANILGAAGVPGFNSASAKFAGIGFASQILGPSVGTLMQLGTATSAAGDIIRGEGNATDVKNILRLAPYYSHPIIKGAIERALGDEK